jgi:hypothetical protein
VVRAADGRIAVSWADPPLTSPPTPIVERELTAWERTLLAEPVRPGDVSYPADFDLLVDEEGDLEF